MIQASIQTVVLPRCPECGEPMQPKPGEVAGGCFVFNCPCSPDRDHVLEPVVLTLELA